MDKDCTGNTDEQEVSQLVKSCINIAMKEKDNTGSYVNSLTRNALIEDISIIYKSYKVNGEERPTELYVNSGGKPVLYANCFRNSQNHSKCIDGLVPHFCAKGSWEEKILKAI
jgi:hypothetical protein